MKRHLKVIISSMFLAGLSCAWLVRSVLGWRTKRGLTILYYHAVPAGEARQFARQMALLARMADIVPACWHGDATVPCRKASRPAVAITFDDALQSVFDNALPVLQDLNMPCTIFVPSGWIGRVPGWSIEGTSRHAEPVAKEDAIQGLDFALVTIGSHTVSHPRLTTLSVDRIDAELRQSRAALRRLTGAEPDLLAFPYGDYNQSVLNACRSAGYRHVFTIRPQSIMPDANAFERGRVAVEPWDSLWTFRLKVLGAYRWMTAVSGLKRYLRRHAD